MSKPTNATAEDILQDHNPQVQAIAQKLRDLFKDTIPEVRGKAYLSSRVVRARPDKDSRLVLLANNRSILLAGDLL